MAWSPSSAWRARLARTIAAAVLCASLPASAQTAPDPKASLADGDKAAKSKDWATAARSYDAANKAAPSDAALDGLANAQYSGGQLGEAHASYTEWLAKYGAKASAAKKRTAETRLKELEGKTAPVTIVVNEAGAAVSIDDRPVGTSPLPAPVRLGTGAHKLRITKDGFAPFEQSPQVADGSPMTVQAQLVSSAAKGRVTVKEKSGKPVRVLVDNVDVGDAPWSGELDPGPHQIGVRGTGLIAAPQQITVERGKAQDVELAASSSSAPVRITTNDGKGLIYLDDKLVGEGSFVADIPAGEHRLKITREGFDPFEETIAVKDKEPFSRTVTLKINSKIETGPVTEIDRMEGVYGGFSLLALFTPGGTGSSLENDCEAKSTIPALVSCDAPSGAGGGLGGFVGYHWDPVGVELFASLQYDQRTIKNDWNASATDPGIGPDPARFESFNVRRLAGLGVARIRLTHQWSKVRLSFATGIGVARRVFFFDRRTTAKDNGSVDVFVAENEGYWSPVVSVEPSVHYRISKGVSVMAGAHLMLDAPATFMNGDENPVTKGENGHGLASAPPFPPRPLTTPAYELASNMQIFIGPFIGMMFGP